MNIKKVVTWISIVGSIASLIGVIYILNPIRANDIKLQFILESCDNLTVFNNVIEPEIKAEFEYKGENIDNLWKLNITLINVSDKTIIGNGQLKNIMYDNLEFYIIDGYHIIDKKLINQDFSHQLEHFDNDTIKLTFGQWRTLEKLEYSFYVTSEFKKFPDLKIFKLPKDRQIIDGDIEFVRKSETKEKHLITAILGGPSKKVIYVLFLILNFILFIVFIIILVSNPVSFVRKKIWKNKYYNIYLKFIKEQYSDDKTQKKYIDSPSKYTQWNNFKGNRYPKEWGFDFEITKMSNLFFVTLVFSVLVFVIGVMMIDIVQLFP